MTKQANNQVFTTAYINKVLNKFYLDKANPVATPIKENVILQSKIKSQVFTNQKKRYQEIIGFIIFLILEKKPNIIFATLMASYFAKTPDYKYIEAIKTIFKYFKETRD